MTSIDNANNSNSSAIQYDLDDWAERIIDVVKYSGNDDHEDVRSILKDIVAIHKAQQQEAVLRGKMRELTHWSEFFRDESMNALTPSERLEKRIRDISDQREELDKQ